MLVQIHTRWAVCLLVLLLLLLPLHIVSDDTRGRDVIIDAVDFGFFFFSFTGGGGQPSGDDVQADGGHAVG